MLIDSHCHLNFPDFAQDLDAVLQRATEAGVGVMQTICTKMGEFDTILAIAERQANLYCSVGVHPHEVQNEVVPSVADLLARTKHTKVIGIGETGLDFYYEHSPRALQEQSFRCHIAAARQTGLPIIIHTREADEETIRILREEMAVGAFSGLIHCFTSSKALADAVLEMGFFISISGIASFKKAETLRETIRDLPLDRLLIETDSPFLAPVPHRGKRNEPAFVVETCKALAELKGISAQVCAQATTENFFHLFRKVSLS